MIEVALNPVTLLISFMTFVVYLYNNSQQMQQDEYRARAIRARNRVEKTSNKDSLEHSGKSKSNFYRNLKVPGESQISHQNRKQNNPMVIRTKTTNLTGSGMMQVEPQNPPIQHQRSTNFNNSGGLRRQISFTNRGGNSGMRSTQASFGNSGNTGIGHRAFATQSGNMPPLFVGFLTNDVSMGHVQFMLDSYTKASENSIKKGKSLLRSKIDRAHERKKRGKFDARFMSSSDDEDSAMVEEEEYQTHKKNRKAKRLLGKRKRSHKKSRTMDIKTVKGKAFHKGEISQEVFKQSFIKVKTTDAEGVGTKKEESKPESPKFSNTNSLINSGNTGALFSNNIEKKEVKEEKKQEGNAMSGLFSQTIPQAPEIKKESSNGGGLFTINEENKKEEKIEEKSASAGLFNNITAEEGDANIKNEDKKEEKPSSGLFNNPGTNKEEQKPSAGLFNNITSPKEDKKPETENKPQETKGGGLFSNFGTEEKKEEKGGLFEIKLQKTDENPPTEPKLGKKEASNSNANNATSSLFNNDQTETGNKNPISSLFDDVKTENNNKPGGGMEGEAAGQKNTLFENNTQEKSGGLFNNEETTNNNGGSGGLFENLGNDNNTTNTNTGGMFNDNNNNNNTSSGGIFDNNDQSNKQNNDNPFLNISPTKNDNTMNSLLKSDNNQNSMFSNDAGGGNGLSGLFNDGNNGGGSGINQFGGNNDSSGGGNSNPFVNFDTNKSGSGGLFEDNNNGNGNGIGGLFSDNNNSGGLFS